MQTEIPFPAEDQFDYASEVLGKLSFQEIKLTSMPIFHGDLSSIIEAISEDVPWVSFLGDFGSLSFRKSGIEITVGERTRIVPGRDKKRLTDEALNNISKDANYLIGLVVGRLI